MKSTNISYNGDQSCSCTSCTYKSEADHPALRRIISQGTRIDRLYYGKYIPLRERKLLEKLVRTRGVYDDIRARLISDSTISLEKKAELKHHRNVSPKKLKDPQYSNEIFKLVNLVDKGEKLESKELSGCCSCCTCSSKYDNHYKHIDKHGLKRAYPGALRHRYIKHKIGDYRKKGVRFKTKHIKSDPCTCTFKFSGMLKHLSKGTPKKILGYHDEPFADLKLPFYEEINQRPHKSHLSYLSNENLQQSKTHAKELMLEGIRKLSETKLRIQEKIDLHEKKSLEKLSKLKSNIKSKVKSFKVTKKNSAIMCKCPENNLLLHIKKDSISKYKDDLKRKKMLKDWECHPECIEDICIPEECYVKLKHKRSRHKNNEDKILIRDQVIRESFIKPIIKVQSKQVGEVGTMPIKMNKQKPRLRAQQTRERANRRLHFTNEEDKILKKAYKDIKKGDHKKDALIPSITVTNKTRAKNLNIGPSRENASRQQVERIGSSFSFNIEFYKYKGEPNTNTSRLNLERLPDITKQSLIKYDHRERKNRKKKKTVHRRHRGSQVKLKYSRKNIKTGGDNSKSYSSFRPRKLMSKRKKPKNNTSMNERTHIKESSSTLNSVADNDYYTHQKIIKLQKKGQKGLKKKQKLLPYECEPNVCIPGICDPYQCIELINNRNAKRKEQSVQCDCFVKISQTEKMKSIPRLTSTPYPSLKTKFVNSLTSYKSRNIKNKIKNNKRSIQRTNYNKNGRDAVRIGSNISFNLEFYKTKYPHPISSPNIKIESNGSDVKSNKKTGSQQVLGDKATTHINKKLYKKAGFGTTLKRCFCTLKIQEKKKTKRKKMVTIGTIVNDMNSNDIVTYNKSTKTKKNPPLNYFECEPFVCIPGACDPYECLDRINRSRLKEVGSVTEPPGKVSVSSTTHLKKTLKAIQVQSKPQSKDRKTLVKTKNNASEIKEYSPRGNSNQAVKIGSSFSFDIQFFKTNATVNKNDSKPYIEQKTKMRSRIQKTGRMRKNSRLNVANTSTQSKQKDKHTKSSMADHLIKRCFCTLNLQKYRKNQNGKQEILATSMFPRDYTINRATTTFNPILTCQKTNSTSGINNIHSKVEDSSPRLHQSTQRKESLIVVEKTSQCYSLNHSGEDNWESRISFIEERLMSLKQTEITNLSQYIRQCFCTMNLQLINKKMSEKNPKTTTPTVSGKRFKEFSTGNKSSVRVGSNFSFNIAFSKNLSSSKHSSHMGLDKPIRVKPKEVKTIGTKGYDNTTFERQSQSAANKLVHKGSAAKPLSKRCFCTLKLHKQGRKLMENNQKHAINTDVPKIPNNTISRGQNTDFKPMKIAHSLKPYECEPNICIPGHCDPYQCLEIMKRRNLKRTKEFGIETLHNKKSASSITSDNHSKGTQKTYQSKMKPKVNSVKLYKNTFESDVIQPSRQVVRVGSNFSFNIEFFKDKGSPVGTHTPPKDFKDNNHINQRKYLSNLREKGIRSPKDSKLRRHKDTEIKNSPNRIASTMTSSFLKRCFCTAQLKKDSSPTFLSKCFSVIKSIKKSTVKKEKLHINKVQHVDKKINTKNVKMKRYQLAPYECEPGICIPGECNPYECEKILKRNRMRTKSTLSGTTEKRDSRSVSIDSQKLKTKNAKIQLKNRENYEVNKTRERSLSQLTSKNSDRQVVRIGSNFSFNIEFYKNNPSKHFMKLPPTPHEEVTTKKLKNQQSEVNARTQSSQIAPISKIDRSTEQKHFLKRCFCTLQLHNQYSHSHLPEEKIQKKKIKQDTKLRDKSVMTKTPKRYELIPEDFECPPGICVPNQCDPYECERIIKMRRKQQEYKEFGMSTRGPKKSTVSSTTHSLKKYKQSAQTIGHRKYHKNTNYNAKLKEVSSSQRVKIGSSFEFNIEFFKNKNNNQGLQINKKPKPGHIKLKHQTKSKVNNAKTQMQKQVQFAKIGDKKTKSQSTMINVSPKLKRCFCTLFMKSAKNKQKPVKKHKTSNIGTETEKPRVPHTSTLLPYECEPQVCIPGECDPVECLERIMKRNKHFGANTNFAPTKSSASTMTPGKAKMKAKKSQFKSVTKSELRTKNKTNLKKQAVRIGSNFNFNIEFYKDNAPYDHTTKRHDQIEVRRGLKKSDFKEIQLNKSFQNAKFQPQKNTCDVSTCPSLKNIPKESQTKLPTFLKKCFCVFKLHKLRNRRKDAATTFDNERIKQLELPPLPKHNIAIQQKLLPYECEPGVCIPGQCDPYECQKRIKARELCNRNKCDKKCYMTQKSQNICTQINNPCMDKCIGIKTDEYKRKKNQSSLASSAITKSTLNESRLAKNLNKQAVKIGSNFSFNIEFYKKSPPTLAPIKMEHIERKSTFDNDQDKNIITKSAIRRNRGSQGKVITSEDKILDVQNELNRCFCTLKLQKNKHSSYLKKTHKYPQYPKTFEVRRVTVQPNSKWIKKQTPVRSVSTRINEKYMKANQNVCPCIAVRNTTEMKTIFPFAPNKFKDTTSKTFFPVQNEIKSGKETKRAFKLNKKKSKRHINYNEDVKPKEGSVSNIKGLLCRCAGVFLKNQRGDTNHRRNNNENENYMYNYGPTCLCENRCIDNLRSSKSDRRPIVNQNTKVRKSKSLKLENKKRNHEKKNIKESNKGKVSSKYAKVPNADNHGISVLIKRNKKNDRVLCSHCNIKIQKNQSSLPPIKVHFDDRISLDETKGIRNFFKPLKEQQNKNVNFKKSENCACCKSCGRRFNKEELLKAAGDCLIDESLKNLNKIINLQRIKDFFKYINIKKINNVLKNCKEPKEQTPLFEMQLNSDLYDIINKDEVIDNITKLSKIRVKDKTKLTKSHINSRQPNEQTPLFEMQLNSDLYDIINKDEVIDNITKLSKIRVKDKTKLTKSHKKSCRCCICLGKKKKMFSKELMVKKLTPKEVIPKKLTLKEVIPKKLMPKEVIPKNLMLKELIPKNLTPKELIQKKLTPKELMAKKLIPKEVIPKKLTPKELIQKKLKQKKLTPKELMAKKLMPKELMATKLIPKELMPKKTDAKNSGAKQKGAEKKKKKAKPCTCGSFVCSKTSQKINKDLVKIPRKKSRKWRPCVCGSPICDRESVTMKSLSTRPEEITCLCHEKLEEKKLKIQKQKKKKENEDRAKLRKNRINEDKVRRKLRKQRDKEMERKINKTSSDAILAAESLIDIGKLGITACTDILRTVARCTTDPKQAYYTLKSMKEDPEVIISTLKSCYLDSGVAATAKRVRLRCLAMKGVKRIKNKLEENAVTNFMLHIADNDPKKRVLKKKKKPVPVHLRERLDFGCSLYMGSLRKRPYLSVYDRWPWFYPHFLSLLNVWKQFKDIMLFLLAVVVWSPCILCMEACRAIMCCFFCTG